MKYQNLYPYLKAKYSIATMLRYLLLTMLVYNAIYVENKALFTLSVPYFRRKTVCIFSLIKLYIFVHTALPLSPTRPLININLEGLKFSFEV